MLVGVIINVFTFRESLVMMTSTVIRIDETKEIIKTANGAESNGKIIGVESLVSMNFLCYPLEFIEILKKGFPEFQEHLQNPECIFR